MSRQFFEHDDRGPSTSKGKYQQRQTFVMGRRSNKFRNSVHGGKARIDLDGDVDMCGPQNGGAVMRFNPYDHKKQNDRRKHKKHGKSKHERMNPSDGEGHWHKITIPYGRKSGRNFILKSINSFCKIPFTPYNFQFNGTAAEFYVNGYSIASHIKEVNRRVTTPDGFKMVVIVSRSGSPTCNVDPEVLEVLKTTMSSHYDPMSHSLNLSKFHHDEALKMQGLYLPLGRLPVFTAAMKIIKENIPEIEVLNLSDNKLYALDSASSLVPVCKQLKFINLRNNKLRSISSINYLKGLDLEELVLDGNPLCDDFKDKATYISAVRDRFPKLMRLDDHELPAPIGFDLGTETLPTSKKSFFAADEVKDLVIKFLDLYYTIYDSGDRSRLLDAYHDQASLSLCLSKNTQKTSHGTLGAYFVSNRNLLKVTDSAERYRLLKHGKLGVLNALQELPQTMHDPSSFSVDIFHVSPGLMSFSVVGVFKEVGADINNATLKTFSRTFVVVPQNSGFVIINETLFIAHASTEQQAKAFKVPAPTPSPSPAPPTEEKNANEKQLLVLELSKQTGMNIDFSTKCLEENDWDFPRSVAVFMKFQSEGKLPPEAFIPV